MRGFMDAEPGNAYSEHPVNDYLKYQIHRTILIQGINYYLTQVNINKQVPITLVNKLLNYYKYHRFRL